MKIPPIYLIHRRYKQKGKKYDKGWSDVDILPRGLIIRATHNG